MHHYVLEQNILEKFGSRFDQQVEDQHENFYGLTIDRNRMRGSLSSSSSVSSEEDKASSKTPSTSSERYKTELCRQYTDSGQCRYGRKCQFAHGSNDLRVSSRHPKYKTETCRTFHSTGFCPYGARCHFVHDEIDGEPASPTVPSKAIASSSSSSEAEAAPNDPEELQLLQLLSQLILANRINEASSFQNLVSPIQPDITSRSMPENNVEHLYSAGQSATIPSNPLLSHLAFNLSNLNPTSSVVNQPNIFPSMQPHFSYPDIPSRHLPFSRASCYGN